MEASSARACNGAIPTCADCLLIRLRTNCAVCSSLLSHSFEPCNSFLPPLMSCVYVYELVSNHITYRVFENCRCPTKTKTSDRQLNNRIKSIIRRARADWDETSFVKNKNHPSQFLHHYSRYDYQFDCQLPSICIRPSQRNIAPQNFVRIPDLDEGRRGGGADSRRYDSMSQCLRGPSHL